MNSPLPCPHCGRTPWFEYLGEQDDRRYVKGTLECCALMSSNICYPHFDRMTEKEIIEKLKSDLFIDWNKRYVPDEE